MKAAEDDPEQNRRTEVGTGSVSPAGDLRWHLRRRCLSPVFMLWFIFYLLVQNSSVSATPTNKVTLVAVGDVMLARGVAHKAAEFGWDYPFSQVKQELRSGDILFGNLECEIGEVGRPVPKIYSFSAPEEAAKELKRQSFTVLSLANNHTFDRGRLGLVRTMEVLQREGIAWTGAGRTLKEAQQPAIIERNGLRVAFLAYSDWNPETYLTLPDRPSIALADEVTIAADVMTAKAHSDAVVVSIHWGSERVSKPTSRQRALARIAIDAGADVILGHHPHVRQPVEWYHGKPIFYSLGNFIFDQHGVRASNGWLAVLRLSKTGIQIEKLGQVEIRECQPRVTAWSKERNDGLLVY